MRSAKRGELANVFISWLLETVWATVPFDGVSLFTIDYLVTTMVAGSATRAPER
jgi:hypothetical protein